MCVCIICVCVCVCVYIYIYIYIYKDKGLHTVDEVRVKRLLVWREIQYPPRELQSS